jgi:DNA-binding CsgD family transcriptional regulator
MAVRGLSPDDDGVDGAYRVSDVERGEAVARLEAHCAAGRLSLDELVERSAAVRGAVTRADVAAIFSDLPDDSEREPAWRNRAWQTHALVFVVAAGGVIALWQLTRDRNPAPQDYGADYWWPLWFGLVWAVALLLHYLIVAGLVRVPAPRHRDEAEPGPVLTPEALAAFDTLTAREREVLAMVAEGCSNREIGRRLEISERTARTHVSNILQKLGLPSRTHAALFAVQVGLA